MLIVRKRNRKEVGEQDKKRAARKRAARIRLVCVSVLVAGLLGFFVYNNIDYFSGLEESVNAYLETKTKSAQTQPAKLTTVHKSAAELLGAPEFFDDNDPMPLNSLLEELAAELAAEEEAQDTAPRLQKAFLTQQIRQPEPEKTAAAAPDTAPRPLVSMVPRPEEPAQVPNKKAPDAAPKPSPPDSTPGQDWTALNVDSVGTILVSQKLTPEFWESLKPTPKQDSSEAWWMSLKGSAAGWLTSQADQTKTWWTSQSDRAKTWWASQTGQAKTWWASMADRADTWRESLAAMNPLKPEQETAVAEQAPPAAEKGTDLAETAQMPQTPAPMSNAPAIKQVSLTSAAEPDSAAIKKAAQAPAQKQGPPDAKQTAQTPKPDTVKVNPDAGSVLISNIQCKLSDRSDFSINVSVELFYESKALYDEVHSKRGTLATVLSNVVRKQEYGNVAMAALSGELLDAFNDVLKSGQLSNVDIRSFNVVQ